MFIRLSHEKQDITREGPRRGIKYGQYICLLLEQFGVEMGKIQLVHFETLNVERMIDMIETVK